MGAFTQQTGRGGALASRPAPALRPDVRKICKRLAGLAFLLAALVIQLAAASDAPAMIAANTQIVNQASLVYNAGGTTAISTSEVTIRVGLVPSEPLIIPGPPGITPYSGPGTTLNNTFTVRSSANGPDTYQLTTAVVDSANTSGPGATITTSQSITLGATVTMAPSTGRDLTVPADGIANNSINGIEALDFVSINDRRYIVASVTDNTTGTSVITLQPAPVLPGGALPAGVPILEEKDVIVAVVSGPLQTRGADVTVDKTLSARSTANPDLEETSTPIRDTFTSGMATMVKYVRNDSQPNAGSDPFVYDGKTYYRSGVVGSANQVMEYLLVVNNASAAAVPEAFVVDILPANFVTLRPNAYNPGEVSYVSETGIVARLTAISGDDAATLAGNALTVFIGGANPAPPGGTIPGGNQTLYVLYQVTINP